MPRIAAPCIAVFVIAASASQLAAQEVNLSRYAVTATAPATGVAFNNIDHAILLARCRDHEGCRVTVKVESAGVLRAVSGVFFLSELDAGWLGPPPFNAREVDGDTVSAVVIGTDPGQIPRCRFVDAEDYDMDDGLLDLVSGFGLLAESDNLNPTTCSLVIED